MTNCIKKLKTCYKIGDSGVFIMKAFEGRGRMMEEAANLPEVPSNLSDEEAFQVLFKQYYPQVVWKVMIILKDRPLAEDVAQEVFVKLYHADRSAIDNLPGWLTKVAVNTAYNQVRTEKRHMARKQKQQAEERIWPRSVEEAYVKHEELGEVQKTLMRLSEQDRDLLVMRFSGYSYEEIAENKGLEKSSIGALLARAKSRFKKMYAEEGTENQ